MYSCWKPLQRQSDWCYVDWAILDGDGRSGQGADWFRVVLRQLLQFPVGSPVTLAQDWSQRTKPLTICAAPMANIHIWAGYWFGWYDVREVARTKRDKYSLEVDQITLSEWGDQCLTTLLIERPFRYWNKNAGQYVFFEASEDDVEPDEKIDVNTFAESLRRLLNEPDLLSLYPINPNPPTGEYWFQVELPNHGVLRTIAIPATSTLDDLHEMIRESVDFDDDHLYNFYLNWRNPLNGEIYSSPDDDWSENPSADTVQLAELSLYEKQKLLYIFDLADRWEFLITVVRHLPDAMVSQPRLLEKVGESPEQYADDW